MPLWIFSVWFSCGTGRIISIIFLLVVSCAELLAARCMATAQCGRTQNNRRRFASGDGRSTPSAFSAQEWNEMWGERDVFVSFQHIRDRIKFHGRYLYATEIWVVRRVYVEKKTFSSSFKKKFTAAPAQCHHHMSERMTFITRQKRRRRKTRKFTLELHFPLGSEAHSRMVWTKPSCYIWF